MPEEQVSGMLQADLQIGVQDTWMPGCCGSSRKIKLRACVHMPACQAVLQGADDKAQESCALS
jgi:hypothetical protein